MNKLKNSFILPKSFLITMGLLLTSLIIMVIPSVTHAQYNNNTVTGQSVVTLTRQLQVGSTGSDVSALQTFLAGDPTIYPQGLVTGYYGALTKAAVARFQTRNGISPVGRVGPATLPVINAAILADTTSGIAPIITGITAVPATSNTNTGTTTNVSSATINWTTNENAKGLVYYSTSPLTLSEQINSVDVSGQTAMTDMAYRTSQSVTLQNLMPNTTYYYLVYTTGQTGNVTVSWPATFMTSI